MKTQQKTTLKNITEQGTLYWHDYETFGLSPAKDRPAQFAGIRTDLNLDEVAPSDEWFCCIPRDYLPDPIACLVTGITPQQTLKKGVPENEFIHHINNTFSVKNTCVVGYNSIRFDDEVTRFTLYRNFLDPYEREYKNGCSRWDIIDMVRACYALRPDGIKWPMTIDEITEEEKPSFRLELLTKENELAHDQAHDAMSDVYATIGIAKLIKEKQPRFYDYCFNLRSKSEVLKTLNMNNPKPVIHVSGMFPSTQGCISYVLPISAHPVNKNAVIVVDLAKDISNLIDLSVEDIAQYMYMKKSELPEGINRPAVKLIHINKCPFVAPAKTLGEARADELGIDRKQCRISLDLINQHPEVAEKLRAAFAIEREFDNTNQSVEEMLYSGGFFSYGDKDKLKEISSLTMQQLSTKSYQFDDPRLEKLLWHYRARNGEALLSEEELQKWQQHSQLYFEENKDTFFEKIESLAMEHQSNPKKLKVLEQLVAYVS